MTLRGQKGGHMACFPMMLNLKGRFCLVAGGGVVALRKVLVLRDFGARVAVTAPHLCSGLEEIPDIEKNRRGFLEQDIEKAFLVVAASDDRDLNHKISVLCRQKGVLVNAADQPEDCDFFFPSYIKEGDVVAAFSSSGQCPVITQYMKEKNRGIVTGDLGMAADVLGSIRSDVKAMGLPEGERKVLYEMLLASLLKEE